MQSWKAAKINSFLFSLRCLLLLKGSRITYILSLVIKCFADFCFRHLQRPVGDFLPEKFFKDFYIYISICHLCRLGSLSFFRSRTPHKITYNNKQLSVTLTLIPIRYGHYLLNSTHTVVVSYSTVSSTSTMSSSTDNISAPLLVWSNRKSAKLTDIIAHDKVYRIV